MWTSVVDVRPRSEARLRAVCEALFVRAKRCCDRDAIAAMQQLGFVRDVVAVTFL